MKTMGGLLASASGLGSTSAGEGEKRLPVQLVKLLRTPFGSLDGPAEPTSNPIRGVKGTEGSHDMRLVSGQCPLVELSLPAASIIPSAPFVLLQIVLLVSACHRRESQTATVTG